MAEKSQFPILDSDLHLARGVYVSIETGGRIMAYLETLWVLLGAYWDQLGGCLEQPWLFLHNLGVLFGLLGPCWDNTIVATPKRPLGKTYKLGRALRGTGNWSAPRGGGHEPQTLVHIYVTALRNLQWWRNQMFYNTMLVKTA